MMSGKQNWVKKIRENSNGIKNYTHFSSRKNLTDTVQNYIDFSSTKKLAGRDRFMKFEVLGKTTCGFREDHLRFWRKLLVVLEKITCGFRENYLWFWRRYTQTKLGCKNELKILTSITWLP